MLLLMTTGGWVRNAYATCLLAEDNPEKFGLILHIFYFPHGEWKKDLSLTDRHAFH